MYLYWIVFRQYNTKIKRWHNELGLFTWDIICITATLGCLLLFGFSFISLVLTILIFLVWVSLHINMKKKAPEVEDDSNGSSTLESADLLSSQDTANNDEFNDGEDK